MAQKTFNDTKINVKFDEATSRQQLNSGENISTLFGKIKKIFSDLKAICFSGSYNDLSDKPTALPASNVTDIYFATGTEPVNGKAVASAISTKVDKISGKNLSTNDLTNTLKNNYDVAYTHSQSAHAPSSAQANVIETIKVNNTALTPTNKTVNITVPSNTDRYVNKAEFVDDSTTTAASPIKMTLTRDGSDTNTITANIPKVSSSSAGVVPKGSAVSSQSKTTKFLREDGTWATPSYTTNTDTKVTAVENHYTPAKSTTKSASGGTLTDITNSTSGTQVVTGVEMDAKGHVTGVTSVALKSTDSKVTVDTALSSTSTNPVQNKVINSALAGKAAASHSHTISQISDFPASLPANGGDADTVDGMHASDFMPINGEVRKYGLIRMNGSDGIRVRHIDGNDTEADGALYLNYNSPNAPIYMNGGNTAIHSGNIGSQSVNYANNAGNANTVGGFADAYHLGTLGAGGSGHGTGYLLSCQHNVFGDNRFAIQIANRSHEVRVDYATNASNAGTVGNVAAGQIPYSSTILDARDCNRENLFTGIDGYTSSALNAPFAGWQTVMSYNCGHFLVQLAVETTSGNLAIRSKWGNTPFSDVSWVRYYGENYKPYVVGTFTLSGNETKSIPIGFTPSYVDVRGDITGFHINVKAVITTNGFTATGVELTQNAAVRYIAFR